MFLLPEFAKLFMVVRICCLQFYQTRCKFKAIPVRESCTSMLYYVNASKIYRKTDIQLTSGKIIRYGILYIIDICHPEIA